MYNKIMTIDDQIEDEKLQYDINTESSKISALLYITREEILPVNQKQILEQVKFTYLPLGKGFEKQIKTIGDQGKKQVDVSKGLKDNKDK